MKTSNLFVPPRGDWTQETFEDLVRGESFVLERIFTTGQVTPEGVWCDSPRGEWVVLLSGAARLQLEEDSRMIELRPGDHLCIPPHCRHRVQWTDPDLPTVWLALHYDAAPGESSGAPPPAP